MILVVPWYWIPISILLSLIAGLMIGGALANGGHSDDCSACQARQMRGVEYQEQQERWMRR